VDFKAGEYRASGRTAKMIFVRAKQLISLLDDEFAEFG
jgi:hypothetical protein